MSYIESPPTITHQEICLRLPDHPTIPAPRVFWAGRLLWNRANNNRNNPRNSSLVLADGFRGTRRPAYGWKRRLGASPGARHGQPSGERKARGLGEGKRVGVGSEVPPTATGSTFSPLSSVLEASPRRGAGQGRLPFHPRPIGLREVIRPLPSRENLQGLQAAGPGRRPGVPAQPASRP